MRSLILLVALASAGCLRSTQFQCSNDTACGASGLCEPSGYCSFPDTDCDSGRRYGDSAGGNAGQCTSGSTGSDSGVDTPVAITDGRMIDGPVGVGCPSGYNVVPNGQAGHLYKIVTAADNWDPQRLGCRATTLSAYLFVPDDLTELTALDAVVGVPKYWIGVSDSAADGTFVALPNNTAQTFLPWATNEPENGANPPQNCVAVTTSAHEFSDERCNNANLPAVCECAP